MLIYGARSKHLCGANKSMRLQRITMPPRLLRLTQKHHTVSIVPRKTLEMAPSSFPTVLCMAAGTVQNETQWKKI